MMVFRVLIDGTGNAAISDNPELAISELVEEVAAKVRDGAQKGVIRDANGNQVGQWGFEQED